MSLTELYFRPQARAFKWFVGQQPCGANVGRDKLELAIVDHAMVGKAQPSNVERPFVIDVVRLNISSMPAYLAWWSLDVVILKVNIQAASDVVVLHGYNVARNRRKINILRNSYVTNVPRGTPIYRA